MQESSLVPEWPTSFSKGHHSLDLIGCYRTLIVRSGGWCFGWDSERAHTRRQHYDSKTAHPATQHSESAHTEEDEHSDSNRRTPQYTFWFQMTHPTILHSDSKWHTPQYYILIPIGSRHNTTFWFQMTHHTILHSDSKRHIPQYYILIPIGAPHNSTFWFQMTHPTTLHFDSK